MKLAFSLLAAVACVAPLAAMPSAAAPSPAAGQTPAKPTEHLIGTISSVDNGAHTITVKDDKSGSETTILLGETRTLIKVAPGAKDLKNATRITADQLAIGDRVDVRGNKPPDDPSKIAARSLVLMSGRDLQAAHEAQAAEWQNSMAGVVTAVDPASGKIDVRERTPEGQKPLAIQTGSSTEFTRYSPEHPNAPEASQLAQVQTGDQVRVIGDKSADGATVTARRVYSGAFRTVSGTVLSLAPDGKSLSIRNAASKQSEEIGLNDHSTIQKIPPQMAAMMAQHMSGGAAGAPPAGGPPPSVSSETGQARRPRTGDISRLLNRLPTINLTDLKPGDAVVVSGVLSGAGPAQQLIATHVIAGVEPFLQAAPAQGRAGGGSGGQSLGGDWGLGEIAIPQ